MKFRKRSVIIEAQQWFPPGDPRHQPSMLARPSKMLQMGDLYPLSTVPGMGDDVFFISTPDGPVRVWPGDWIITEANGDKRRCKPEMFEAMYEPLEEVKA